MAVAAPTDFKYLSNQACLAAKEFGKLYFSTFDRQRHKLVKLYAEISTVVWNGNAYAGTTKINEFFVSLPATAHKLTSMDCQPINRIATSNRISILVVCEGYVKYGNEKERKYFSQTFFLLLSDNEKWKIISDCFRFIDNE